MDAKAMLDVAPPPQESEEVRICRDLGKIGLGQKYHFKRFQDLSPSPAVSAIHDWAMADGFPLDVLRGKGASLYGEAHDLFMVLARATHLRGVTSRVISTTLLVQDLMRPDSDVSILGAKALFLHSIFREEYKAPFSERERITVEEFLMERLDEGSAVFTLADRPLPECSWWSKRLLRRLEVTNFSFGL